MVKQTDIHLNLTVFDPINEHGSSLYLTHAYIYIINVLC